MRKLVFIVAFAAFGFIASEASAVTVLNTTQGDVKKQCEGKTKCSAACGSTLCDYVCEDPKKQCTVAIFLKKRPGRIMGSITAGAKAGVQ